MNLEENQALSTCVEMNQLLIEDLFEYRYSINTSQTWISKRQLINAYHHAAFKDCDGKAYDCNKQSNIVDAIVLPTLGAFGIIGNISGMVYFSKRLSLTYYSLLFSLSMSDLVTIISFILYYSLPHWIDHYTLLETPFCTYVISWFYSILHIAQLLCIYLLIALSIERYFAICKPITYRARKFPAHYYIIPIVCFSFIYSIPLLFENYVRSLNVEKFQVKNGTKKYIEDTTINVIKHSDFKINSLEYQIVYETIFKLIIKCVIPYITMITTNVLVVRTFCTLKITIKKEEDDNDKSEENQESNDPNEGMALRLHTSRERMSLRQSQINLGYFNLVITLIFLLCYSIIWLWAIRDFLAVLDFFRTDVSENQILSVNI